MAGPFCTQWFYILLFMASSAVATPIPASSFLQPRDNLKISNTTGAPLVFDSDTQRQVPQGSASDGSGSGFDMVAVAWIVFASVVGLPMAFAGIRGWKITSGTGIGLAGAVCSWAAVANAVSENGIPDTLHLSIVLAFFAVGFVGGLFNFGVVAGIALLALTGGLAFGIRIVLIKDGLLLAGDLYVQNWIIITACAVIAGICFVFWPRSLITFGSASVGTFLISLAVDLVLHQQQGISRGLRFLFDRNNNHHLDIIVTGYHPTITTQIILAVSLALTPILAYAQHIIFKHPFSRKPLDRADLNSMNLMDVDVGLQYNKHKAVSRFSI